MPYEIPAPFPPQGSPNPSAATKNRRWPEACRRLAESIAKNTAFPVLIVCAAPTYADEPTQVWHNKDGSVTERYDRPGSDGRAGHTWYTHRKPPASTNLDKIGVVIELIELLAPFFEQVYRSLSSEDSQPSSGTPAPPRPRDSAIPSTDSEIGGSPTLRSSELQLSEGGTEPASTNRPAMNLAPHGRIVLRTAEPPVFPVQFAVDRQASYILKLSDASSGNYVGWIGLRGPCSFEVLLPKGTYELSAASGLSWKGGAELFGPETVYQKYEDKLALSTAPPTGAEAIRLDTAESKPIDKVAFLQQQPTVTPATPKTPRSLPDTSPESGANPKQRTIGKISAYNPELGFAVVSVGASRSTDKSLKIGQTVHIVRGNQFVDDGVIEAIDRDTVTLSLQPVSKRVGSPRRVQLSDQVTFTRP